MSKKIMWQNNLKWFFAIFFSGLVITLSLQFLYPRDTSLPFSKLYGSDVSRQKYDQIYTEIETEFNNRTIEIYSEEGFDTVVFTLSELGFLIDADAMTSELLNYNSQSRWVPFSILTKRPEITSPRLTVDEEVFLNKLKTLNDKFNYDAQNAGLKLSGSEVVVKESKNGFRLDLDNIRQQILQNVNKNSHLKIKVEGEQVLPEVSDVDISKVANEINFKRQKSVTIFIDDKEYLKLDGGDVITFFELSKDKQKNLELSLNEQRIKTLVEKHVEKTKVSGEAGVVTLIDGEKETRQSGRPAESLDSAEFLQDMKTVLLSANVNDKIFLKKQKVNYQDFYVRKYSKTEKGLQAYVNFTTHAGNIKIVVKQLDGEGWKAFGRANEAVPSASTYKMYVAWYLLTQLKSGATSVNDPMLDTNVSGCFERMIVVSTNACAENWLNKWGRSQLNNFLYANGISKSTDFSHSQAVHTSARDLAFVMSRLSSYQILDKQEADILLDKMSRQVHRYGIPTGTQYHVQDKVGYLWDYIHDGGIVHHKNGRYVLVVMTKGQSYAKIAEITRDVEEIMYGE